MNWARCQEREGGEGFFFVESCSGAGKILISNEGGEDSRFAWGRKFRNGRSRSLLTSLVIR